MPLQPSADRYETLLNVIKFFDLKEGSGHAPLKLYLCDWGYNTARARADALANPLVELIDAPTFSSLVDRFVIR